MRDLLAVTKALSDENRVRMLLSLPGIGNSACVRSSSCSGWLRPPYRSTWGSSTGRVSWTGGRRAAGPITGRPARTLPPPCGQPSDGSSRRGRTIRRSDGMRSASRRSSRSIRRSYVEGNSKDEDPVPVHRQLLPEPDGGGVGTAPQGGPDRARIRRRGPEGLWTRSPCRP